jgi:predicted small lipoprotein YifL
MRSLAIIVTVAISLHVFGLDGQLPPSHKNTC